MKVEVFPNGPLSVNSYLLYKNRFAVIIDPGHDLKVLLDRCSSMNLEVKAVLLTHGHLDHIAGVAQVLRIYPKCSVKIDRNDLEMACAIEMQSQMLMMDCPDSFEIDEVLDSPCRLDTEIGEIDVVRISGHSSGSVCYIIDNTIFSGDTLFNFAVGRTDLLGSTSNRELIENINNKLIKKFSDTTRVFPGHGPETTIGFEKENNIMLKGKI